jgi:hypothetical protein
MKPLVLAVLLGATTLLAVTTFAQGQSARPALADVKTLECEFPLLATGTWTNNTTPAAEVTPSRLRLGFREIDTQDGSAEVIGSVGAPNLIVQFVGGYLHFMQVGQNGFLYTTTVFNHEARPGRLKAVHSRHEFTSVILPGFTSRPQQYYGDCAVLP